MVTVRNLILFLSCSFFIFSLIGCTDLTEYNLAIDAGLYVLSSTDFSQINSLSSISNASALLIYPGNIFILSTDGVINRFDSSTLEKTGEFAIGSPSPAAYSEIEYCSVKNSAYIIGSLGKIIEISLPDCTIIDEFSVCESPVLLLNGVGSRYLFVADGPSSRIHQVAIDGNIKKDNVFLYYAILSMASCENPDSFAVGTSDGLNSVEVLGPASLRTMRLTSERMSYSAMEAILNDTLFVGMRDNSVGVIDVFHHEPMPGPSFYDGENIPGSSFSVAMGNDMKHAYVLSYIGDNTSRLTSYNFRFAEEPMELDIPGYPLDLKVSGNGDIYVLTTE